MPVISDLQAFLFSGEGGNCTPFKPIWYSIHYVDFISYSPKYSPLF